jgi:antitoxin (DNA-binding transcriptional repressor) of toxin-antitoxin stability system
MKAEVGIAELKGKLSAYLRAVRQGGEIVIKDRETPIPRRSPSVLKCWNGPQLRFRR